MSFITYLLYRIIDSFSRLLIKNFQDLNQFQFTRISRILTRTIMFKNPLEQREICIGATKTKTSLTDG